MTRVARIASVGGLSRRKTADLTSIVEALATVRAYIWRKYGSINGVCKSAIDIQDETRNLFDHLNVTSHVICGTILDAADKIKASRESAKRDVRKAIYRHTKDAVERKRLFTALKFDSSCDGIRSWTEDDYLRRQMRKYWRRGISKCRNQIVLPVDCYKWFELNGRGFIDVSGLIVKKFPSGRNSKIRRIALPLNTNRMIRGQIRIIIKDNSVDVHYGFYLEKKDSCGPDIIGVDKGYTEALVDSNGCSYGSGLGRLLAAKSDELKTRHQARRRLDAIAEKSSPEKKARIEKNNLGKKKWNRRKDQRKSVISTLCHRAAHAVVDKAAVIVTEDLTRSFSSKKSRGPNVNRRMHEWVKGEIDKALNDVASRRCASVKLVNAAYTSQICCDCGCFGKRSGDTFYCDVCRDVKRSDHVSAKNVLARLNDKEIKLYTPYRQVKEILLARASSRLRLSNPDSSCAEVVRASTESELSTLLIPGKVGSGLSPLL